MGSKHIVKSFDEDLVAVNDRVKEMGLLVHRQLLDGFTALIGRDASQAHRLVEGDRRIDQLEREVDGMAVDLIARRQPVASDLRNVITSLRVSRELERIGDYGKSIAKHTDVLIGHPPMTIESSLQDMVDMVAAMVSQVVEAFVERDGDKAQQVRERDQAVDRLNTELFRRFMLCMTENSDEVSACTHLLLVARALERIGDHATNVADDILFLLSGEMPQNDRVKADRSYYVSLHDEAGSEGA